ncbi:UPF0489 protein C5orf22 homolog [Agrilus planipennis]|uniref:UPF0489 protein C5orf22 homolog n=1 Tax=Agrilus planipennis TaxID=224129 RepID=A0A1W4XUB8_AGRPL|nr:UPF0489 protein C5orf22 homolog [Agrilus planipennis]
MDRTMYGKFVPGTLHPYQCTLKKGTLPGCKKRFKNELRQYQKIPIYVVEYHHEVLPFIYRNIGSKYLPLEGTPLVHFDSHPDMLIDPKLTIETVYDKESLYEKISIESWILPGTFTGQFGGVIWVKPFWAHQMDDGKRIVNIGEDKSNGCIRLDCKEDYFVSECIFTEKENLKNERQFNLNVITMNKDQVDWNGIECILNDSLKDKRFILDVDLDFFSTHNPFKNIYDKVNLYALLKKLYYCDSIKTTTDDVATLVSKRIKQMTQLESIFNYLDANRKLPSPEGYDQDIYNSVDDVRKILLEKYEEKDVDWELVHLAGCTCDNSELPHYVCSSEEFEIMYTKFKKFLDILPSSPTIVTISRSTEDDYTPDEYVEEIQSKVIEILKNRFCCDDPILSYLDVDTE